jgi:molybdopterin converting factor small subunit
MDATEEFIATSMQQPFQIHLSTVKVALVYLGQAREVVGTKEEEFVLPKPAKLEQAFSQAMTAHPKLSELKETLKLLVNGRWATEDQELNDGDRVTLLPPVGGG